jgi:2-polyprenyl-6-methoxyphenol hydroxylase-like FAD-dependent oxidoreductase
MRVVVCTGDSTFSCMIVVVGAGPGGLAAGLALGRAGFEVEVWERAPALRTAGAGLTLQGNAMRMLDALGVAEAVRAAGAELTSGAIVDDAGAVVNRLPLGRFAALWGQPGVGIHRGTLARILSEALGPERVRFGRTVTGLSGGCLLTDDGVRHEADLVVGADGIHSVVRTSLFGPRPLRYAGYTCWRGVAHRQLRPGTLEERWGPGLRLGTVPIGGDRVYWFAVADAPPEGVDPEDRMAALRARFAVFEEAHDLFEATPADTVIRNDIVDFAPLDRWSEGRVTLLGDAAHAMTPNLGQGACQAIEDAVVLAASLEAHGLEEGPRVYEAKRRPRANALVHRSRRFGAMAQLRSGWLRTLRNVALRGLSPEWLMVRSMDALYGVAVPRLSGGGDPSPAPIAR